MIVQHKKNIMITWNANNIIIIHLEQNSKQNLGFLGGYHAILVLKNHR